MLPINTDHYMIDLETLGTEPTSIIMSIGACKFDTMGLAENFYLELDLKQQRTIDLGTLKWWLDQPQQPPMNGTVQIHEALNALAEFIRNTRTADKLNIWCAGTDFDVSILSHAYKQFGMDIPWSYNETRDYRTVRKVFEDYGNEKPPTAHNALLDAQDQAEHLISIFKNLEEVLDDYRTQKSPRID